jgi:hypothetical protein
LVVLQPEVAGEAKLNGLLALYSSCSTAPARYMVLHMHTLHLILQPEVAGEAKLNGLLTLIC